MPDAHEGCGWLKGGVCNGEGLFIESPISVEFAEQKKRTLDLHD